VIEWNKSTISLLLFVVNKTELSQILIDDLSIKIELQLHMKVELKSLEDLYCKQTLIFDLICVKNSQSQYFSFYAAQ